MKNDKNSPEAQSNLAARQIRHDGWTVERQEAFLKALARCGCITDACRAVGMSRQSAHNLYQRPSAVAFRAAWDAALDSSLPLIEGGAWERSIKGVARPIFHRGEQIGEYRHFDERLTMFLLRYRRPHRYRDLPLPPVVRPPGREQDGPDPDEAIGTLDFHLDDLVDEADLPGGISEASHAYDGVNFVNFVDGDTVESCDHPGLEPGPAFSWNDAEDRQMPDQIRHDDDCDGSEPPLEPAP